MRSNEYQMHKSHVEARSGQLYRPRTVRILRQRSFLGIKWWQTKMVKVYELVNH